jgi:hypothetical protein
MKIYLDGTNIKTKNVGSFTITDGDGDLKISEVSWGGSRYFKGDIDEVVIYKRTLEESEILQIKQDGMDGNPISVTNGLAGYWAMNEGSGTTIKDSYWRVSGIKNNALNFDGVNDYVSVLPTSDFSNLNKITLMAWVNFAQDPSGSLQEIAQKWEGWTFGYYNDGWWHELYSTDNDYIGAFNDAWIPVPGTWYHITSTYDGSSMKTYVDGNLLAEHPEAADSKTIWNNPTTSNLGIGAGGWTTPGFNRYFHGIIDEVKIYDRALTQSEITAIYNSEVP